MTRSLGQVSLCLSLLSALQIFADAKGCKSEDCTMLTEEHIADTSGISLMQSGGSIVPVISKQGNNFALGDGLLDEFAAMEDEFDDGYAEDFQRLSKGSPATAQSLYSAPMLHHVTNPYLYVETLLVIAVLSLATRIFKWIFSKSPSVAEVPEPLPKATASADSEVRDPAGGKKGFAALEQAVRSGDEDLCLEVLKQGGRWAVRQEDPCGCTALHIAAHCGSAIMARLLLKHGAKVDACEAWDETPLHFAARGGSVEVCDVLLAHGASIDVANAYGWTPLLAAGHAAQEATCEMLLSHGAGAGDVEDTDLPPLLNKLFVRHIFAATIAPVAEINPKGAWPEEDSEDQEE